MILCFRPLCSLVSGAAAIIGPELAPAAGMDAPDSGGAGTEGGGAGVNAWSGVSSGGGIDDWIVVEIIAPMSRPSPAMPMGESTGSMPMMTGAAGAIGMAVFG